MREWIHVIGCFIAVGAGAPAAIFLFAYLHAIEKKEPVKGEKDAWLALMVISLLVVAVGAALAYFTQPY